MTSRARCDKQGKVWLAGQGNLEQVAGLLERGLARKERLSTERFSGLGVGHDQGLGVAGGSEVRGGGGQAVEQCAALERSEEGSLDSEPVNS